LTHQLVCRELVNLGYSKTGTVVLY